MAKIEDLVKNVPDSRLRDEIEREVAKLKATKKFGLVFEEHIPEQVQLPGLPLRPGVRVAKRGDGSGASYLVVSATKDGVQIRLAPDGPNESAAASELVVVKRFGDQSTRH